MEKGPLTNQVIITNKAIIKATVFPDALVAMPDIFSKRDGSVFFFHFSNNQILVVH
jgi:hypothetical protein